MKKYHFIAGLAILALAVSCDDIKAPGVDKKIDTHSEVSVEEFTSLKGHGALKTSPDGKYFIEQEAGTAIKLTVDTAQPHATASSKMTIDGAGLPEVSKPVEGAADNFGIIIEVDNTSSATLDVSASASIDGKSVSLAPGSVKPNDKSSVAYVKTLDNPDKIEYETPVLLPDIATEPMSNGIDVIDVSDITVMPKKGATALAAASAVEISLLAKYYTSLSFPAGTKLHLNPTFSDLKINLDRVNFPLKEYDLYMTIESTIPFDMKASVTSSDGVSGTCDDIVKAGAVGKPVKSAIVVHIKDDSGHNVSQITNATFSIDLVAGSNAYFGRGQYLKIDTEKLTIQKVN